MFLKRGLNLFLLRNDLLLQSEALFIPLDTTVKALFVLVVSRSWVFVNLVFSLPVHRHALGSSVASWVGRAMMMRVSQNWRLL